ncbi:hypothetical protein A3H53_01970 [Candidatus Nomurabacteria bacterium RIFCSPLOWO2_02_FULL_40_10]|uniref:AbiEi antitoxin C-terminal domain-containing protein n=1 Tax=Candidatus Nomurabacteria bacterium RIFCSPLOWO2_02_FULL_40_10 TaxID=1801786 RepID=A0A1F6XW58_9BACT|nr:MAG: hypothetical protein A3H53_01970 [Candidatus Nomurabacteria bacterium RIFCSPLOWO2_02_FULL_40_10]
MNVIYTSKNNKIKQIVNSGQVIFCDTDLAVIWGIIKKNTLYTTIKRYTRQRLLEKVRQGIYSIKSPNALSPDAIGAKILHGYCYVSAETALERAGILKQKIRNITFVSGLSKKFSVGIHSFSSRQMKDVFLYNSIGVYTEGGINYACAERAVADLLYFNPKYYFDGSTSINWDKVKEIKKIIGY